MYFGPKMADLAADYWVVSHSGFPGSGLLISTFQQPVIVMLRANVAQLPQTAEDRRVSAPVVAVESGKQLAACTGAQGKECQSLSQSEDEVEAAVSRFNKHTT